MVRTHKVAIALLGSILLVGSSAVPAIADEDPELPTEFVAHVTSVWTEYGVSPATQAALLEKLGAGQVLDANLGAEPVSATAHAGDDHITQVNTFADGSISVLTTELPTVVKGSGGIGPMGIAGCYRSGLTYTDCTTSGWYTGVSLGHLVSYRLHQGNYAYFISWGSGFRQCSPGLICSDPTINMVRQYQTGTSASAWMNVSVNYTYAGVGGGGTTFHYTYLRGTQAWTS
jgi:hypothetical protein